MIFSRPLAASLLLLAVSSLGHGRAIPSSLAESVEVEAPVKGGFFASPPLICGSGTHEACPDDLHLAVAKRAGRPLRGSKDGPEETFTNPGTQRGDDIEDIGTGGTSRTNPDPNASGPERRPDDDPIEATYRDIAPGEGLPPGIVRGENALPAEIPSLPGIGEGGVYRESFQRFLNYDAKGARTIPKGNHYLFYSRQDAGDKRGDFQKQFNGFDGNPLHREGLEPGTQGQVFDIGFVYENLHRDRLNVPAGADMTDLTSAFISYGFAKRAAQEGGVVRLLLPGRGGGDGIPSVIDWDRLQDPGTFFNRFEFPVLTAPDSRVTQIYAYNAFDLSQPGVPIWVRGDPNGHQGFPNNPRTLNFEDAGKPKKADDSDEELIDLGD